ncbi:MAG TPA: AraC family transcriptional regulator [Candidatus Acidoferrum sp.]|nr:AraC family transcriptional regulator [Candidatus Acidoferrum sp.]
MSLIRPFRHALPVSEALFHEPLYLTHAGWEQVQPGDRYPSIEAPIFYFEWREGRTLPEFCLALNVAGGGDFETRGYRGRIQTGDAFLFRPGEWHRHRPSPKTGWTIMWIHFNGDLPLRWLHENAFHLKNNVPIIANHQLFRSQFEHLLRCVEQSRLMNSSNFSLQTIGLISHFVLNTCDRPVDRENHLQDEVVKIAIEYIWNFSHDIVNVPAVARHVKIARRTLDRHFKAATGHSVLDEIQFCRVSRAAKLLQETDMPIKHIVQRAGFRSGEHLRLAFQKNFGQSPQEFQRNRGPESKNKSN